MNAMIFAAGLGTRLKPITDTIPKALVPIGGQTLLERTINNLKSFGFDNIVVNVHHFPDMIIDYIKGKNWGITVNISDERDKLLDTGGGLKKALPLFSSNPNVPILLHNVDILSNANLRKFYHENSTNWATLMVSSRETSRYLLFDANMCLVGWTNIRTGEVRSPYGQINPNAYHRFAFSGIHLFSPKLESYMKDFPERFPIMDFYLKTCEKVEIKGCLMDDLKLLDVGKLNAITVAEKFVSDNGVV